MQISVTRAGVVDYEETGDLSVKYRTIKPPARVGHVSLVKAKAAIRHLSKASSASSKRGTLKTKAAHRVVTVKAKARQASARAAKAR